GSRTRAARPAHGRAAAAGVRRRLRRSVALPHRAAPAARHGTARRRRPAPGAHRRTAGAPASGAVELAPPALAQAALPACDNRVLERGSRSVQYFDETALSRLDPQAFRQRRPYPWHSFAGLLRDEAFERLRADLPPLTMFQEVFGKARRHGQQSHDRYALEHEPGVALAASWQGFIDELQGARYRAWLGRALGTQAFELRFHWHYTPSGSSVSPHCDAARKLGSHIFYFNTEADWDAAWGGETLILDDGGRFSPRSAP